MSHTHFCPGGCGSAVPRHHYACRVCWYRLPAPYRDALRQHHHRKTEARAVAIHAAHTWYLDNPLPPQETH